MSRKRVATVQLTDLNWNQEDRDEDSDEVEENEVVPTEKPERKIKKAVRRSTKGADEGVSSTNPFQSFGGFGEFSSKVPPVSSLGKPKIETTDSSGSSSNFWTQNTGSSSFFNPLPLPKTNLIDSSLPKSSVIGKKDDKVEPPGFVFSTKSEPLGNVQKTVPLGPKVDSVSNGKAKFPAVTIKSPPKAVVSDTKDASKSKYLDQIVDLNISVLAWVKQHIDENPCIDLTPVFKDYEAYMTDIEKKLATAEKEKDLEVSPPKDTKVTPEVSPVAQPPAKKVGFFSPPTPWRKESEPGEGSGASPKGAGFFASLATSTPLPQGKETEGTGTTAQTEDDEDDEPKKEERKTIVEDDAFFTSRCKLFFKKGDTWQELGVGMLYLKPLDQKTQLLIRMETATGKILLNVCLLPSMPVSRTGKNNVTLISIPNPPVYTKAVEGDNSKPVPYLIRVKGSEEADKLFEKIKECKEKET